MIGKGIEQVCFFCRKSNLGQFKKEIEGTNLVICSTCVRTLTIEDYNKAMRFHSVAIQKLTLKEILKYDESDFKPNGLVYREDQTTQLGQG